MESMDDGEWEDFDQVMDFEEGIDDSSNYVQTLAGSDIHSFSLQLNSTNGYNNVAASLLENGRDCLLDPLSNHKVVNNTKDLLSSQCYSKLSKKSELDRVHPVMKPDLTEFASSPASGIRHLWIGHSTSLIQIDGLTILTDPMFNESHSSVQFVGDKRFQPSPCSICELPHVDIVLISHPHHNHADYASITALNRRYGESLRWYVPQGLKEWMMDCCSCSNVVEMKWWQEDIYFEDSNVRVVCTPCERTIMDENEIVWCTWCVIGPRHSYFFIGDTSYSNSFEEIGKRYGPFTLSNIPVGTCNENSSPATAQSRLDLDNLIKIHKDVQSQTSIGIHLETSYVSNESQPHIQPKHLEQEIQKLGMKPSSFFTVSCGETTIVGADGYDGLD